MTTGKKHTPDQIVAKLAEARAMQDQGMTIGQLCRRLGVTDQTFYRWRLRYGAVSADEAQRLIVLAEENARLKRIVAEQALEINLLRGHMQGLN